MASILEIAGYVQDQGEKGRARGLASLVGKAYGAPREERQAILGAVASRGAPQMAYDANKHFEGMDDSARERLGQYAAAFDALPDEQKATAYPQLAKQAQELGIPAPAEWNPAFAPNIQKLAQSLRGGGGYQVQSTKVGADGFIYTIGRDGSFQNTGIKADPNTQIVEGAGGFYGVDKRNMQAAPVQMGQQPAQAAPQGADVMGGAYRGAMGPQGVQGAVQALAGQFGGQVSSLQRTPEHNARVGGVANSQHIAGTAGDVVVPQAQRAAFIAAAQAQGLEAIDEGDHVHLELPPNRGGQMPQGGGQLQAAPPKVSPLQQAQFGLQQEAARRDQQRLELAQRQANRPTSTGGVNAQKLQQANATKMAQFSTAERAIQRLETAANSIAGNRMLDGGPMDRLVLDKMPEGQELQQAGASLLPVLTALTRVPGVGSQSDLESRLASLQMPSTEFPPEVNKRAVAALRAYIRDLKAATEGVQMQRDAPRGNSVPVNNSGDDDLIGKYL